MVSFGEILERLGGKLGNAPALIHGDETIDWATLNSRSNALANAFAVAGARPGDRLAHLCGIRRPISRPRLPDSRAGSCM